LKTVDSKEEKRSLKRLRDENSRESAFCKLKIPFSSTPTTGLAVSIQQQQNFPNTFLTGSPLDTSNLTQTPSTSNENRSKGLTNLMTLYEQLFKQNNALFVNNRCSLPQGSFDGLISRFQATIDNSFSSSNFILVT
jgi:hypothetical protein